MNAQQIHAVRIVNNKLREIFVERLQEKNSWGKNEVRLLFEECLSEATLLGSHEIASKEESDPRRLHG